jgi:hypothetical protein
MKTRKFLLLASGVIAIAALLATTNAFAQFDQCTSYAIDRKGNAVPGSNTVAVDQTTEAGRTTYTYTVTGDNANKFFVWVRRDLYSSDPGFSATCTGGGGCVGEYVVPGDTPGNFPPAEAWNYARHEDGVVYQNIAINNQLILNVKERFQPEESLTTVLLGSASGFEFCGPIYGPKNPATPEFEGSPVSGDIKARIEFENGCSYNLTAGATDNLVKAVERHPDSPDYETVGCGGEGQPACQECQPIVEPGICESDTGFPFCPPLELGRPPLFTVPGGTCYAPPNIKYPC